MAKKPESSAYINQQRHAYSLYVMQMRAIPAVTDGLKAGGRRVLWTARDGKKYKSATLAGATMPIHPHAAPEGAIDTLAAPYGNNIPLFKGDGAFGTLLKPTAYGASRYTSVSTSTFTDDVVFKDIEIVPMTENYDGTLMEPVHFLPLIPIALLNPSEGIAVGYATNILPRSIDDIVLAQITHLKGAKKLSNPMPKFAPLGAVAYASEETDRGVAYYFNGELTIKDTSTATIVKLPYGQTHEKVVAKLDDLLDKGILLDYTDRSKNVINIELKFKRGYIKSVDEVDLYKSLGLTVRHIENLNVLDFTGKAVWNTNAVDLIRAFTDWRLGWYVQRYQRLLDLLQIDLQRYLDIRTAIKNNVSSVARKTQSRAELKDFLEEIKIVYTDYIADLPVYRFTEDERIKNEERIKEAEAQMQQYRELLASEDLRKKVYVSELQDVLAKHMKGGYK
jgi:DNA gyrase/topoisomerase IV subunit A